MNDTDGKKVSEQQFDRQEYDRRNEVLTLRKKELEHVLDRILYFMMSAQDDTQVTKWSRIAPQDILSNTLDQLYQVSNLGGRWFPINHLGYVSYIHSLRDWRKKRGRFGDPLNAGIRNSFVQQGQDALKHWIPEEALCRKDYPQMPMRQAETSDRIPPKWEIAFELDAWETHLRTLIVILGCLLHKNPGYVTVGQLEKVQQAEQTYSNVGNKVADMLSNLPRYVAYCTLVENHEVAQYKIDTEKPLDVGSARTGNSIRKRSRLQYGRDRNEVEAAIRKRLGIDGEAGYSTPPVPPVAPSQAPREANVVPVTPAPEPAPVQRQAVKDADYYDDEGDIVTDD